MKQYLQAITTPRGATAHIAYYADTPDKNYRIYYCGTDTGELFERLGNASRSLRRTADEWKRRGILAAETYTDADNVPRRGSNV